MYAVHCVLAGLSYMLMHILDVGVGMTFSGGAIDLTLFGILQGNQKTNWIWIVIVGLAYAVVYYFVFYFMITRLNLKTPGREPDGEETKLYTRKDMEARNGASGASHGSTDRVSALILKGLGGRQNLSDVDCCATRLRVTVNDPGLVSEDLLKESGASGVIRKGNGVQVVYGPQVSVVRSDLEAFIDSPASDDPDSIIGALPQTAEPETAPAGSAPTVLYAHMTGKAVPLEEVGDEVFSAKVLGEGIAIEPAEGRLYAPCDGRVDMVFDTKHAVNIVSSDGCEVLLHIGIDTVKLGGKYFESHVEAGQQVRRGDLLVTFDMEKIRRAGYKLTTPMIVGNTEDYGSVKAAASGEVRAGEEAIRIN